MQSAPYLQMVILIDEACVQTSSWHECQHEKIHQHLLCGLPSYLAADDIGRNLGPILMGGNCSVPRCCDRYLCQMPFWRIDKTGSFRSKDDNDYKCLDGRKQTSFLGFPSLDRQRAELGPDVEQMIVVDSSQTSPLPVGTLVWIAFPDTTYWAWGTIYGFLLACVRWNDNSYWQIENLCLFLFPTLLPLIKEATTLGIQSAQIFPHPGTGLVSEQGCRSKTSYWWYLKL